MTPRNDVAIYMPYAASMYDRGHGRTGGAERQTILLARSLKASGLGVAHIVFPMREPRRDPGDPELVVRPPGRFGLLGRLADAVPIWRAMAKADARTYVFRGSSGMVGIGAAFCLARGRRLVFSGANDGDFTDPPMELTRDKAALYWYGLSHAHAIVVQSERQRELASTRVPGTRVEAIPSFIETADRTAEPEAFLWAARVVDYKRPEAYLELARAVPEARFRMVIVPTAGDTEAGHAEELRAEAASIPNLELLEPQPHAQLMDLVASSVAIVNTSTTEGMPNVWLEGWARGVPALTLAFDPDGRVANGLGYAAADDPAAFAAAARKLWAARADRGGFGPRVRAYVEEIHGEEAVGGRWRRLIGTP